MKSIRQTIAILFIAACSCGVSLLAHAETVEVTGEATIRGGAYAQEDQNEAGLGYLHVKYSEDVDNSRKVYLQFDVSEIEGGVDRPAVFTVRLKKHHEQAVQLWALEQPYEDFSENIIWDNAQANDRSSNRMEAGGRATAMRLGQVIMADGRTGSLVELKFETLAPIVRDGKITLAITGVSNAKNDAGGLRLERGSAKLEFEEDDQDEAE